MALHWTTNITPTNWNDCMFRLFMNLATAGWQTIAWSDGTTPHNTPISNPYPYSSGTIGFLNFTAGTNGLGNSRAYIVMQQPPTSASLTQGAPYAGTRQLVWQRSTSDNRTWRIKYSFSGGYTSPSTAGTGANTPGINSSIFDEVFICGGGTDASPTFDFAFGAGTEGGSRCNLMADDGYFVSGSNPYPYAWYIVTFTAGGAGGCETEMMMDSVLSGSAPITDPDPFLFGRHNTNLNASVFNPFTSQQRFSNDTTNGVHLCWFAKNQQKQQFVGCASAYFRRGSVSSGYTDTYPQNIGANSNTNEDDILPVPQIRYAAAGGASGYKGLSGLMRYTSSIKTTGTSLTVETNRDRISMNAVTLPWDGTLPTV